MTGADAVGFLYNRSPGSIPTLPYITHRAVPMATVLRDFGTSLFLFSPRDVDPASGIATGLLVGVDAFEEIERPVPSVIGDWHLGRPSGLVRGRGLSLPGFRRWARDRQVHIYPDERLARLLRDKLRTCALLDDIAPGLHPPTERWDGSDDAVRHMLCETGTVYLKPNRGSKGDGIIVLEQRGLGVDVKAYAGGERRCAQQLPLAAALDLARAAMEDDVYVLQAGIDVERWGGAAPLLRVIMVHDGDSWQFFGKAVLALDGGDVANTSQGGSNHTLEWLLERLDGAAQAKKIIVRLRDLCFQLSACIEQRFPRRVMELGFDLLLDRDRNLHVVELNTKPGMTKPGLPAPPCADLFHPSSDEAPAYTRLIVPHATWLAMFLQCRLESETASDRIPVASALP